MKQVTEHLPALVERLRVVAWRHAHGQLGGLYRTAFGGAGMEYRESRRYQTGDDPKHFDWNVTARTQRLHVKQFDEERDHRILFALDCSPSMKRDWDRRPALLDAIEFVGLLGACAERMGDRAGVLFCADRILEEIPPRRSQRLLPRLFRPLQDLAPVLAPAQLERCCHQLLQRGERGSVLFLLSDFVNPDVGDELGDLARRNEVIAVHLQEPLISSLPELGRITLGDRDPGGAEHRTDVDLSDRGQRQWLADEQRQRWQRLSARFQELGVEELRVPLPALMLAAIMEFCQRRRRRTA